MTNPFEVTFTHMLLRF